MNIFEELAESYTYNGVVSLKALDDDIVTLENQIDSYNATLKELQVRGKKVGPIVNKIRDAKIRLSLLKAVYKRESDKATPDDVILNMLGVSAKNAKEMDDVGTAADGREPKQQNFESAELEEGVVNHESTIVKVPEKEKVVDNGIVTSEKTDVNDTQVNVLHNNITDDEPGAIVQVETESSGEESKTPEVEPAHKEQDFKNVSEVQIPTEKGKKNVKLEKSVSDIDEAETVPFPTIDDFYENESGPSCEEMPYDENAVVYSYQNNEELLDNQEVVASGAPYDIPGMPGEVVLSENVDEPKEVREYDAFYEYDNKIYVSFDLCDYTDMVNTNSITGTFNHKRKTLELTFTDVRDYPIFTFLLNEKNKKCGFFERFTKKPKSIIMYVRTETDGVLKEYRYEFTGCRLVEIFDSEYKSMRDSTYYPASTHEFYAKFKYKRFKMDLNGTASIKETDS